MNNGTTFPDIPGGYGGGASGGSNYANQGNGDGGFKKTWPKDNQEGGWQKKPWQPGGGGGKPFQRKEEPLDPTIYIPCAVSGNKDAPPEILNKIKELVTFLSEAGLTIRTGCDGAVELAADDAATLKRERILPWRDFAEKESKMTWNEERAFVVAKMHHPTYDTMKKGVQHILGKNARLVLGDKMKSPARFILIWTEDGAEHATQKTSKTGLTGHIIAIASASGVPIYNLGNPTAEQRLRDYVAQIFGK